MKKALLPLLLVGLLVAFRLMAAWWPNAMPGFEPMSAMFFCAAACLGLRWLWVPAVAWLGSYPITNAIKGYPLDWQILLVLIGFALAIGLGWLLRKNRKLLPMLGGAIGVALLFYTVTNLGSWLLAPYPKTWAGFWQAQTVGLPGYIPAWVFLKNAIMANLIFTALFLLGQRQWAETPSGELAPARVRH